jgi:hypothetical protein
MTTSSEDIDQKFRCFDIGRNDPTKPTKRMLLLGETGSGKTTLLNGIPNYLYSVEWDAPFRVQVVTEDDEQRDHSQAGDAQSQADSQTDYVTVYRFNWQPGMACGFNLEVIDTPGFGDIQGIRHDEEIIKKLEFLFKEKTIVHLDQLDAIALTVQASETRLTVTRKYIFDSIMSIVGKDAIENLLIMTTFADGGEPQVMHAIRADHITFRKVFKFNNSALFALMSGQGSAFARQFWEMGMETYKDCFALLFELPPQSLSLTREVLRERGSLHATIQAIQRLIAEGIGELDKMEQEQRALQ